MYRLTKYILLKLCIRLVFLYTIDISVGALETIFQLKRKLNLKNVESE